MRNFFLFFFCIALSCNTEAQNNTISYFFDKNFNITKPETAAYLVFVQKQNDTLWSAEVINKLMNVIASRGFYRDSLLQIKEGSFKTYSNSGLLQTDETYINGIRNGLWLLYDEKGKLIDSSYFQDGNEIIRSTYLYNDSGLLSTIVSENKISRTSITSEYSPLTGKKIVELLLQVDKDILESKTFFDDGNLRTDIIKQKNDTISKKYYNTDGEEISQNEFFQNYLPPEFPEGILTFLKDISEALNKQQFRNEVDTIKSLTIIFYLDRNGQPYNVELSPKCSNKLLEEISHVLHALPSWKMYGRETFGPVQIKYK